MTTLAILRIHPGNLLQRVALWRKALPMVKPMYAVKCNPHPHIVRELYKAGVGFDVASPEEIRIAKTFGPADVIYANPCKSTSDILFAKKAGVVYTTFDTIEEFLKINKLHPTAKPVLRLHVDDMGGSRIPLNTKFGFRLAELDTLVQYRRLLYGVAFHVGSDCKSAASYISAFRTVRSLCDKLDFNTEVLDIGGGFSGNPDDDALFTEEIAPAIAKELETLPQFKTVLAEPGRFFAENACTAEVEIIGKKTLPDGRVAITIDESLYGLFSGVLFDGYKPEIDHPSRTRKIPYVIFGRTCDSADKIADAALLPGDISIGDVLTVRKIGAYSYASSTTFNGFPKASVRLGV